MFITTLVAEFACTAEKELTDSLHKHELMLAVLYESALTMVITQV
jgi:hypothetical protein